LARTEIEIANGQGLEKEFEITIMTALHSPALETH
jgi:hypothetical protein